MIRLQLKKKSSIVFTKFHFRKNILDCEISLSLHSFGDRLGIIMAQRQSASKLIYMSDQLNLF